MSRVVIPGLAHHVTQRGNRCMATFFCETDYQLYLALLARFARESGVEVWAYCLMPNHVHLMLVPREETDLARLAGEVHRRYTQVINEREGWKGHLWQGRFYSVPLGETHLFHAARYIELNPVRAGLVGGASDWRWSSAAAHLVGQDDGIVLVQPLLQRMGDWCTFLATDVDDRTIEEIRLHERTGRPLGDTAFLDEVERLTGRSMRPGRRGRKPADQGDLR